MTTQTSFLGKFKSILNRGKGKDVDMTVGSIYKNILWFALPLMIGNLFQQLYNMVDTWVIGRLGDDGAFSAVGSVGPVINMLIGSFSGLASGAGVVISQHYGAKDSKKVHDAVHTSIFLTLVLSVIFTLIGVFGAPFLLKLMLKSETNMASVYPHAKTYLTIYFSGISAMLIYNMGSGILRAVGDSKRPFYFLVVAALTNIALDFYFVFGLNMGVAGVALATVISQIVSAILVTVTLLRTDTVVKLRLRDIKCDKAMLKRIVGIGLPASIQMALTSFSNVFVQSYVANVNQSAVAIAAGENFSLAGWTSYSKIDQFIFLPVQAISLGVTTFVGQNLGCGNTERAKKGTRIAFYMGFAVTAIVIALVLIFTPWLAGVFNPTPEVVYYAKLLLYNITPFYIFCSVNQVFTASMRGAGNAKAPMVIMLLSFVGFRQLYLFIVSTYISNNLLPIAYGYPAGWFLCAALTLWYYKFIHQKNIKLTDKFKKLFIPRTAGGQDK